jgi:hypothetical protein
VVAAVTIEEATNAKRESAVYQQVHHLSHFLFISVISFLSLLFFIIFLPQVIGSNAGNTKTEFPEGAMADAAGVEALNVEKESFSDQ